MNDTAGEDFGFPKKIAQQQKILQLLEQHPQMSLSQLHAATDIRSRQTVLSYVQELATVIQRYSPNNQLQLTIQANKGIHFHRANCNLTTIKQQLYSQSLVYKIMYQLLLSREFVAHSFCEQQGVSFSKLRRQIKKINQALAIESIKIKVGETVQLVGDEWQLRFLLVLFFYKVDHGLPMSLKQEADAQWNEAQAITQAFSWTQEQSLLDIIALILFVNKRSNNQLDMQVVYRIGKDMPEGLTVEQQQVWLILAALDQIPLTTTIQPVATIEWWLECFQTVGGRISPVERGLFQRFAHQQVVLQTLFFPPNTWFMPGPSFASALTEKQEQQARLLFEATWEVFQRDSKEKYFSKAVLWQVFLQVLPRQQWQTPLNVYLQSAFPQRWQYQVQQQISNYFTSDFQITFVAVPTQAQVIVSTEDSDVDTSIPTVWIEEVLVEGDWLQLSNCFQAITD